ncbi:MAG: hypothetical protein F6K50_45820, partial [Moorea sp. SIO3I7]|nr:hypothetical protein [Moorena sp. SIO3I7]
DIKTKQAKPFRFPIPDSRFPIPDSRFPIPDSRFPIPDSLCYNLKNRYNHGIKDTTTAILRCCF